MRILIHKETGTRHIAEEEDGFMSLCGYNGVNPQAEDVWEIGQTNWFDEFPEDAGQLPNDCEKCAKALQS